MYRYLLVPILLLVATLSLAKDKSRERFEQPGPIHLDKAGKKWADKTLR